MPVPARPTATIAASLSRPDDHAGQEPGCGADRVPVRPSVRTQGRLHAFEGRLLVVAAHGQQRLLIEPGHGEEALRRGARGDGREVHLKGLRAVRGDEDPRLGRSAGHEGETLPGAAHQAGAAGRERPLVLESHGHARLGHGLPRLAAVVGGEDLKPPAHRISEERAVAAVPERDRVPEAQGFRVREHAPPGGAAVRGLVHVRGRARADAHGDGACSHPRPRCRGSRGSRLPRRERASRSRRRWCGSPCLWLRSPRRRGRSPPRDRATPR